MKQNSKNHKHHAVDLKVATFPWFLAIFATIPIIAVFIDLFTKNQIDTIGKLIMIGVPVIFLCLIQYKKLIIRSRTGQIILRTLTILKQDSTTVPFYDVKEISVSTGRGSQSHRGVLNLTTRSGKRFTLTSMGALSQKELRALEKDIKQIIAETLSAQKSSQLGKDELKGL